jgi:hypothetical protein
MAWVSPTGYSDPDSGWTNEAGAYDGNTTTYALNTGASSGGKYLELTHSAISCDKVRIYACEYEEGGEIDVDTGFVDVYYGGAWHNIFEGLITKNTWTELVIGSTQTVTSARVKSEHVEEVDLRIKEFEFNQIISVSSRPKVGGSLAAGRKGLV